MDLKAQVLTTCKGTLTLIRPYKALGTELKSSHPITMENPYKEPLKKCILCGKRVDYKNVQKCYIGMDSGVVTGGQNIPRQVYPQTSIVFYIKMIYT
ncbi:hypothetical protein H8959_009172 [Pygathrix nigripes]